MKENRSFVGSLVIGRGNANQFKIKKTKEVSRDNVDEFKGMKKGMVIYEEC